MAGTHRLVDEPAGKPRRSSPGGDVQRRPDAARAQTRPTNQIGNPGLAHRSAGVRGGEGGQQVAGRAVHAASGAQRDAHALRPGMLAVDPGDEVDLGGHVEVVAPSPEGRVHDRLSEPAVGADGVHQHRG